MKVSVFHDNFLRFKRLKKDDPILESSWKLDKFGYMGCNFLPIGDAMGPQTCFASFIFAKNNEIVINSTNTEAREKISMDLKS